MAHDLHQTEVFDVNGQKYCVGYGGHGHIQIQSGRMRLNVDTGREEFWAYNSDSDINPHIQLDSQTAQAVAEYLQELAE